MLIFLKNTRINFKHELNFIRIEKKEEKTIHGEKLMLLHLSKAKEIMFFFLKN